MKKYGNITLAEQNDIILSLFSKEMFVALCDKHHEEWGIEWQSSEAFKTKVNRLVKGEVADITMLGYSDNSISDILLKRIIPLLKDKYGIEADRYLTAIDYTWCLCNKYIIPDMPKDAVLPIRETQNVYIKLFCDLGHIFCPNRTPNELWNEAIDELKNSFGTIANFCKEMDQAYKSNTNADYLHNLIYAMKDGRNPTWAKMQGIVDFLGERGKALSTRLLEAYFATNYAAVVNKYLGNDFTSSTEEENAKWKEVSDKIRLIVHEVIDNLKYKSNEEETLSLIREIETMAPQAAWFYCNWLNGFIEVAKRNYNNASELYNEAFKHCHFAGDYIERFLCQAIALSLKINFNIDAARKSIDPNENSKIPLPKEAKQYWNYGWAIGVFEKKADEAHIEAYGRDGNFSRYFRGEMFVDATNEDAKVIEKSQVSMEMLLSEYSDLHSLSEKDINHRRRSINGIGYHPIVIAIFAATRCFRCGQEQEGVNYLSLVDYWLANFKCINMNVISDNGSTIATDAIQQYGSLRRENMPVCITDHFKRIIVEIVRKTDNEYLTIASAKKGRSALQEAINAFDYDLVKEIAERINVKDIKISQDMLSPIDYCKNRLYVLRNGLPIPNVNNVDVSKMNVPGLTLKDKEREFMKMLQSPFAPTAATLIFSEMYGVPKVRNVQEKELNMILDYLKNL